MLLFLVIVLLLLNRHRWYGYGPYWNYPQSYPQYRGYGPYGPAYHGYTWNGYTWQPGYPSYSGYPSYYGYPYGGYRRPFWW